MNRVFGLPKNTSEAVVSIKFCKNCNALCEEKEPIVGCKRTLHPIYFSWKGEVYRWACGERVWFDKDLNPVRSWDPTTAIKEYERLKNMTEEEFWEEVSKEGF